MNNSLTTKNDNLPSNASVRIVPVGFQDETEWRRFEATVQSAHGSGLLPDSIKNLKQALMIALKGKELGLELFYALSHISVVNGKCMIEGQAMLSLIYKKYPNAQIRYVTPREKRDLEATVTMSRSPEEDPDEFTFSMEDAKRAGLTNKPPWKQYPQDMLRWRAVGQGARFKFPDAVGGLYVPGELHGKQNNNPETATAEEMKQLMEAEIPESEMLPFEKEESK